MDNEELFILLRPVQNLRCAHESAETNRPWHGQTMFEMLTCTYVGSIEDRCRYGFRCSRAKLFKLLMLDTPPETEPTLLPLADEVANRSVVEYEWKFLEEDTR
jgi:hypothetical protein